MKTINKYFYSFIKFLIKKLIRMYNKKDLKSINEVIKGCCPNKNDKVDINTIDLDRLIYTINLKTCNFDVILDFTKNNDKTYSVKISMGELRGPKLCDMNEFYDDFVKEYPVFKDNLFSKKDELSSYFSCLIHYNL
ncbi:MAG: hypothetical protein HY062_18880 [Bacteroidetes bacterium]|nr:hypothetical protein [Bacteroidota bacterium]